jgi:thiol-disulfide isomerase/thioredoxin
MNRWCHLVFFSFAAALGVGGLKADPAPGMLRDEVISRYGAPKNSIAIGGREIMTFDQGKVVLESGHVLSCDFAGQGNSAAEPGSNTPPAPKPIARTGQNPVGGWFTDFDQAKDAAQVSHRQILALFTGSTWCPACIRFDSNVSHDPHFLSSAQKKFVLVKIDYPHEELPHSSKAYVLALRYQVGGFPTLLKMKPDGSNPTWVDIEAILNNREHMPDEALAQIGAQERTPKAKAQLLALGIAGLALVAWWIKK